MNVQIPLTSDRPWWRAHATGDTTHDLLLGLASEMKNRQKTQLDNTRRLNQAYQWGVKYSVQVWDDTVVPIDEDTHTLNAAQDTIDTVHAKVCKPKIRPMPLTEGGTPIARRRARDLGRAIEGVFADCALEEVKEDVVMDALVTDHGAGAAIVYADEGQVRIEHVPVEDLFFDEAEVRYRKPRCLYRRIFIDRYVAAEKFGREDDWLDGDAGERRRKILSAPKAEEPIGRSSPDHDQIELWEAWHLRSRRPAGDDEDEGSDDGRHAIVLHGCTLMDRRWDGDRFPIVLYAPRRRRRSIWGISLMRTLLATQREYETITEKIQRAHHRMGGSHFAIPKAANVDARELDNGIGTAFEYEGNVPPQVFNPDPCSAQTYQYADKLPLLMHRRGGLSELSVASQIPAGLSQASGKALQVFDDFEAERLLPYYTPLERWIVAIMWAVVDVVRELIEHDRDLSATYRGRDALERVKWRDLLGDHKACDFDFQVFPVSNLARTPAARFAQLQELLNAGAITIEAFRRLYELPDLAAENELDTADTDLIDRSLDSMVCTGRYISPEPYDNLDLAIQRAGKFYSLCRLKELPDDRLELIRQYIQDAMALSAERAKAQPAAAPGAPPPGPEMQGPPAPNGGAPPGMPPGLPPEMAQ